MAGVTGIARRYADAAFEVARQDGTIDRWLSDLEVIEQILADPALRAFVEHPKYDLETKKRMLGSRLMDVVQPKALNLLYVLTARGRLDLLPAIRAAFQARVHEARNTVVAEVTTAVPLDETIATIVRRQLEEHTGKRVLLKSRVDPTIIGGMIIKVGDKVLDGSTRARLVALRRNLVGMER